MRSRSRRSSLGVALVLLIAVSSALGAQSTPTMKQWLSLRSIGGVAIAPDGGSVAYTVTTADWENNRYDAEIWLTRSGAEPIQLTSTEKESSTTPRWSPDSKWIGFLTDRGDGRQIYLIHVGGGEAKRLTSIKGGVNDFSWSHDGSHIAFTSTGPEDDTVVARRKTYGDFTVENADFRVTHLWVVAVDTIALAAPRMLPLGDRNVGGFAWSPDGRRIAFAHTPNPLLSFNSLSDISIVDVGSGALTSLVTSPGSDAGPVFSPDGNRILFSTADGDTTSNFFRNARLAMVSSRGGPVSVVTKTFDENPGSYAWTATGVRFLASQGTSQRLFALDTETHATRVLLSMPDVILAANHTRDGSAIAFIGESATALPEIYRVTLPAGQAVRLTNMSAQVSGWSVGSREVVSWASKDGTRIEGVLYKPNGYLASKRYPLLVAIHGGPTGISRPVLGYGSVYPIAQFLAKGAVVLMPNYRGSAGYGEKFRSLNVRNLGVGDAWDVLSGVDSLIARGIADSSRMGSMGWSQGGYISAFLTTTSNRFKAISVGAGISDWMTYYVSTDIHPFTRQYLKATPWSDPAIYATTSPITYVKQATTPTLIQHGELDRRVPISNAYELFQALQDVGVPSKLVVYKGFGHGITKPKEQLAATWHNWQWFSKYIWGEDVALPADGERAVAGSLP